MAGSTATADRSGRLRRILGVGFGLAVIIGSTLGIGILRTPGMVAGQLHDRSAILLVWLVGGAYTMLGAVCLAELGTLEPHAGGYYAYARRAFGDWAGFVVGWTDWLTYTTVLGYISIGMSELVGELVPSLAAHTRLVAVGLLVVFVGLQWAGVRVGSRFQEWATALKFLAFLALVVVGLVLSDRASEAHAAALPPVTTAGVVEALQAIVITYAGWQSALYFTEEDRDPARNLPRAMIGGVVAVTVIYVLINLALLVILPIEVLGGAKLPAIDAARQLVGGAAGDVMTIVSLISLPPLINAILMIGTRILFALGRDRMFWPGTARINRGGTPDLATLATTGVAIVLILAIGDFRQLVAIAAFFLAMNYAVCCLALVVLRRREPGVERPFRAWGYPWSAIVVIAGAVAVLAGTAVGDPTTSEAALAAVAVISVAGLLWWQLRDNRSRGPRQ